jgi:hypothetical protein
VQLDGLLTRPAMDVIAPLDITRVTDHALLHVQLVSMAIALQQHVLSHALGVNTVIKTQELVLHSVLIPCLVSDPIYLVFLDVLQEIMAIRSTVPVKLHVQVHILQTVRPKPV